MGVKDKYLTWTGSTWEFRQGVPAALVPIIGKREFKKALGDSLSAARLARDVEAAKARMQIAAARVELAKKSGPPPPGTQKPSDLDLLALTSRWFNERERRQATLDNVDVGELEADLSELIAVEDGSSTQASIQAVAAKLLRDHGFALDRSSDAFRDLERLIRDGMIESEKRLLAKFSIGKSVTLDPKFAQPWPAVSNPQKITVGEACDRFGEVLDAEPVELKAKNRRDTHLNFIANALGRDTHLEAVKREDVRRLKNLLATWPTNVRKRPALRDLTFAQVAALEPDVRMPHLNATTANAYLATLNALFSHAGHEEWTHGNNPAAGLKFPGGNHTQEDRLPFTKTDLHKLFHAPLFTGCKDGSKGYAIVGSERPRNARFWLPLISLFHGFRLNEICQLREDNFQVIGGYNALVLAGMRVKSKAGKRMVPLHPTLEKLGLMDVVNERREADGAGCCVFPDLTESSTGYLSENFSKWFKRYMLSAGVSTAKVSFHSLRHNWRDATRRADIPEEQIDWLGGWAPSSTSRRYGGDPEDRMAILKPLIDRVQYPFLDLSHLHVLSPTADEQV